MKNKEKTKNLKTDHGSIQTEMTTLKEWTLIPEKKNIVYAISDLSAGGRDREIGKELMLALLKDLPRQESLPRTIVFYNEGVRLACESSKALSSLEFLQEHGVNILICETSLQHYKLVEKLAIGSPVSPYRINACFLAADYIIRP